MGDDAGPMLRPQMPVPESDALDASRALTARIEAEIAARDGWITFAHYMQLALYAPGLGYYTGGAAKFGPAGAFLGRLYKVKAGRIATAIAEIFQTRFLAPVFIKQRDQNEPLWNL